METIINIFLFVNIIGFDDSLKHGESLLGVQAFIVSIFENTCNLLRELKQFIRLLCLRAVTHTFAAVSYNFIARPDSVDEIVQENDLLGAWKATRSDGAGTFLQSNFLEISIHCLLQRLGRPKLNGWRTNKSKGEPVPS